MKKFSVYLGTIIVAALLIAAPLSAQQAQQDWNTFSTGLSMPATLAGYATAAGAQTAFSTAHSSTVVFHVVSSSTSTASVVFEQSLDGTHFYQSATITNPTSVGEMWACPGATYARFNVATHSAGTLAGYYTTREWNSDPLGASCKKLDVAPSTLTLTNGTFSGAITGTTGSFSGAVTMGAGLGVTGGITATTTIAATAGVSGTTGAFSAGVSGTTGTFSSLTATYVPYAGTGGLLSGAAGFTYIAGAFAVPTSVSSTRFLSTGTAPTTDAALGTCGTTAASIVGKDQAGIITVGSVSGTICHATFNVAFAHAPACVANASDGAAVAVTSSTAAATFTGTFSAGSTISYNCLSY